MPKNSTIARLLSLAVLGLAAASYLAFSSCSTDPAEPREIRAHTRSIEGVSHAEPANRAERYCSECHGANLQGGFKAEPSCYTCHGKNWLDDSFELSLAPPDHTVSNEGYRHHPNLYTPLTSCSVCHGAELQGDVQSGLTNPGCDLCHTKLWEERLPTTFY